MFLCHHRFCIWNVNTKSPRFGRSGRGVTTGVTSGEGAPFAVAAPEAIFRKFPTGFPTYGTKDRESLGFPLLRGRGVTTGETEEPLGSPFGDNPKTYQISIHITYFAIFYAWENLIDLWHQSQHKLSSLEYSLECFSPYICLAKA